LIYKDLFFIKREEFKKKKFFELFLAKSRKPCIFALAKADKFLLSSVG